MSKPRWVLPDPKFLPPKLEWEPQSALLDAYKKQKELLIEIRNFLVSEKVTDFGMSDKFTVESDTLTETFNWNGVPMVHLEIKHNKLEMKVEIRSISLDQLKELVAFLKTIPRSTKCDS